MDHENETPTVAPDVVEKKKPTNRMRAANAERARRFRERQQLAAADKAEARQVREAEISKYGQDRVANRDHANLIARLARHINDFYQGKDSNITAANISDAIACIEDWLGWREKDSDLDDDYKFYERLGEIPSSASGYRDRYQRYLESLGQSTQTQLEMSIPAHVPVAPVLMTDDQPPVVAAPEPAPPSPEELADELAQAFPDITSSRI